jgi:hypothetical protein
MVFMRLLGSLALNVCNGCSVRCKHDLKHSYGSQGFHLKYVDSTFYTVFREILGFFLLFVSNWPSL